MMATINELLHKEFLETHPVGSAKEVKKNPDLPGEMPPAPVKVKRHRTLGDVFVALQSQKVYDPGIPSVPSPQPAPANTFQKGVTPALDTSGAWGGPAPAGER